jgi:phage major head subunit gpT-like protein
MKVTPAFVVSFETNLQTFVVDGWKRIEKNLIWDKFMDIRPSQTLRELYFWLLETAQIYDENQGGNKRYDDMAATFYEIDNINSGVALRLTKNEIEDNMMASPNLKGMPALDYAANWAKQVGGAGGYRPQEKMFALIAGGKTTTIGYDGVTYFNAAHPTNVVAGAGAGTYSNLVTAVPLATAASVQVAAANINTAVAAMRGIKQPNGKFRMLRPRVLLHDPSNLYTVNQLLDSKFFNASENVLTKLGIEPVCADELSVEPGVWYLGAELMPGEGGPFIWQDREPYYLTSYTSDSMVELQRRKAFEWLFDGRNAAAPGHPYLFFRCEPT